MGSIFARPLAPAPGSRRRRAAGRRSSPAAASARWTTLELGAPRRSASAPSARGCRPRCSPSCDDACTIPLRPAARVAQRRDGGDDRALRADRVAAMPTEPDDRADRGARAARPRRRSGRGRHRRARGAAGPLPRPQGRAAEHPARRSPSCRPRSAARSAQAANEARQALEALLEQRAARARGGRARRAACVADRVDVTLPGAPAAARSATCT